MSDADGMENGSEVEVVPVSLGTRGYDIRVGARVLAGAGEAIKPFANGRRVVVVCDENVADFHLDTLAASLGAAGVGGEAVVMPAGESTKSFNGLSGLLDRLFEIGIERRTLLVALGGGVIGDLVGFAAAVALRGIDFVQVPTTLLAQVDSSVGGKTGINVEAGKNLVGAFHQPRLVLADTEILESLPWREFLAGYAEVVKYGAIDDRPFFEWLEEHGPAMVKGDIDLRREAIARCCRSKARIVADDEREGGVRALLNLGHTFGHALEGAAGYDGRLLHGEAVAIGMVMAFALSRRMDLCPGQDAERLVAHLKAVGLPTRPGDVSGVHWDAADLIRRMGSDKKVKDGMLTFILARGIGDSFITQDVPAEALEAVVAEALAS
ncbi:3-dehydroquinate synthase [Marivibrio halodurans]|uniref:3-dehydroquinate synthase n=1 Tax=Marivibrio halodurans TaxID=2039722 RepID=A0A8J7V5K9_9PROT|nr:3-dehydroquinate synthase [Marivibrio halodurans]MBP5859069.1 3-dehydroquinate synthase [Marivibrio halodurans]